MFSEQLQKILKLIKKTGDRVIVFEASAPEDAYVLMDFARYARTMTGEELVEKGLIANNQVDKIDEKFEEKNDLPINNPQNKNLTEEDLTDKINREISMWKNREDSAYLEDEAKPRKTWQIPSQVKNNAKNIE